MMRVFGCHATVLAFGALILLFGLSHLPNALVAGKTLSLARRDDLCQDCFERSAGSNAASSSQPSRSSSYAPKVSQNPPDQQDVTVRHLSQQQHQLARRGLFSFGQKPQEHQTEEQKPPTKQGPHGSDRQKKQPANIESWIEKLPAEIRRQIAIEHRKVYNNAKTFRLQKLSVLTNAFRVWKQEGYPGYIGGLGYARGQNSQKVSSAARSKWERLHPKDCTWDAVHEYANANEWKLRLCGVTRNQLGQATLAATLPNMARRASWSPVTRHHVAQIVSRAHWLRPGWDTDNPFVRGRVIRPTKSVMKDIVEREPYGPNWERLL